MQAIFRIVSRSVSASLAAAFLLSMTGCETAKDYSLTYRLWSSGEMRRFYEPASPPRLELFHDLKHSDVLAVYDEAHEIRTTTRRRAYFVNRNRVRVEAGRKPRFVNPERARSLPPIALAQPAAPALADSAAIHAVMISTHGQQFTLSGDFGGHDYRLPVYPDRSGGAGRVLLSPFAVAGDVIMVGIVAGVLAAYAYAGGGSWHP